MGNKRTGYFKQKKQKQRKQKYNRKQQAKIDVANVNK